MHADDRELFYESSVRFDPHRIRAAAVYCSDGRFGDQFDDLLQNALNLPRYDRLAIPGGSAWHGTSRRIAKMRAYSSNCVFWLTCTAWNASS